MTKEEYEEDADYKSLSPRQQVIQSQRIVRAEALLTAVAEALQARSQSGRGREYRGAMLAFLGAFEEASEDVGDKRYERQRDEY